MPFATTTINPILSATWAPRGANADYNKHDDKDWRQPQRKEEGRGWAKATTSDNTYTGKGGSKRD